MATNTQEWIDELKSISVLELSERIKALEEEVGVPATAGPAAAPAAARAARPGGATAAAGSPTPARRRSTSFGTYARWLQFPALTVRFLFMASPIGNASAPGG